MILTASTTITTTVANTTTTTTTITLTTINTTTSNILDVHNTLFRRYKQFRYSMLYKRFTYHYIQLTTSHFLKRDLIRSVFKTCL